MILLVAAQSRDIELPTAGERPSQPRAARCAQCVRAACSAVDAHSCPGLAQLGRSTFWSHPASFYWTQNELTDLWLSPGSPMWAAHSVLRASRAALASIARLGAVP